MSGKEWPSRRDHLFRSALDALVVLARLRSRRSGRGVTGNGVARLVFTILSVVAKATTSTSKGSAPTSDPGELRFGGWCSPRTVDSGDGDETARSGARRLRTQVTRRVTSESAQSRAGLVRNRCRCSGRTTARDQKDHRQHHFDVQPAQVTNVRDPRQ